MERNIAVARRLLETVQRRADVRGIEHLTLMTMCQEAGDTQLEWQYAYRLLVDSGFLLTESGSVQLTWGGHELLEDLQTRTA